MKSIHRATHSSLTSTFLVFSLFIFSITACKKETQQDLAAPAAETGKENPKALKDFVQVNLVGSDNEYNPARIDPNLINAWGISFPTSGPAWVSAEGTALSLVLAAEGNAVTPPSPVHIPGAGTNPNGHPTGQVFNRSSGFKLPNNNPARFIFAGADGVISGWNGGANAIKMVDDSPDAAYLGIAIAADGVDSFLYAANFAEGSIDVYDDEWNEVSRPFMDPGLPSGYSPFNIQAIDNKLYVMYAKVGADGEEEVGQGKGYVDIFNTDGTLDRRFISNGQLNAPWGVTKAPAEFWGPDAPGTNVILVGNFGDGHINAYSSDGNFLGQLRASGNPIVIEGLWGIEFAPSTSTAIPHNRLYFAAGPDDEEEGLFGYIRK